MEIPEKQMPAEACTISHEERDLYHRSRTIESRNDIPDTTRIPIANPLHWLKIPDAACVFVDMKGSTQLSATLHDRSTAGAYRLFTGSAVWLFDEFDAPYIDVRGNGVLALFNRDQVCRAVATERVIKAEEKDCGW
jgi:hypothetical protein